MPVSMKKNVLWKITSISEMPDDGDSKNLWNIGQFLWNYMEHPIRQSFSII
jgi:hypothetical protein